MEMWDIASVAWSEALGGEPSDGSDFFECGGESILAADLARRLSDALGISIPGELAIICPRFGDLVDALEDIYPPKGGESVVDSADGKTASLPILPGQRNVLMQRESARVQGRVPIPHTLPAQVLKFSREVDPSQIVAAVDRIVRSQPVLRAIFHGIDSHVEIANVSALPSIGAVFITQDTLLRDAREMASTPFELADVPRLRLAFFYERDPDCLCAVVVLDHLAADGTSWQIFMDDLGRELAQPSTERKLADRDSRNRSILALEIGDVWKASHGPPLQEHVDFWREELDGNIVPSTSLVGQRNSDHDPTDARPVTSRFAVSREEWAQLERRAAEWRASPFALMLAALWRTNWQISGRYDSVVTPSPNRRGRGSEEVICSLAHAVVRRTQLRGPAEMRTLTTEAMRIMRRSAPHERVPYSILLEELQPSLFGLMRSSPWLVLNFMRVRSLGPWWGELPLQETHLLTQEHWNSAVVACSITVQRDGTMDLEICAGADVLQPERVECICDGVVNSLLSVL